MTATSLVPHATSPSNVVQQALDHFASAKKKMPSNQLFMSRQTKQKTAFQVIEPGLSRKANGKRIYARVCVNGRWTWRSTKTNEQELARKWKENWDRKQWLEKQGFVARQPSAEQTPEKRPGGRRDGEGAQNESDSQCPPLIVDQIIDNYVTAGHPTIRKRKLRPKLARSIRNEEYCLTPIRVYFGEKIAEHLCLGDCDKYHRWRCDGRYTAKFTLRGKPVERPTKGGDRAVDLELVALSNSLELAVRQGHLTANPIRDRGQYADESDNCRKAFLAATSTTASSSPVKYPTGALGASAAAGFSSMPRRGRKT